MTLLLWQEQNFSHTTVFIYSIQYLYSTYSIYINENFIFIVVENKNHEIQIHFFDINIAQLNELHDYSYGFVNTTQCSSYGGIVHKIG